MNIENAVRSAFSQFRSGNLEQAANLCRKILHSHPDNVRSLYLLGLIYSQIESFDLSAEYFRRVIGINPENAGTYINLGNVLYRKGSHDDAISSYRQALHINPNLIDAYIYLGTALAHNRRYDEAIPCCEKALKLAPQNTELWSILGIAYQGRGQLNEAIPCFRKVLEANPDSVTAYNNLGIILHHTGQFDEAIQCYQTALKLDSNLDAVYINLGNALQEKGQLSEAALCYQKVLQRSPASFEALNNLGNISKEMGLLDEAESYYRRAIQYVPNDATAYQNLLMIMHYDSRYDAQTIFHAHLQFAERYAAPLSSLVFTCTNEKIPARRLKIGYVSPDFRKQSVGFFIGPVLESHNHDDFEIFCYANLPVHDEMSERMRKHADRWRNITGLSDEKAAELIRSDGIDILVDLAGHTAFNRLLLFARRPAPVQATWIGYPDTTGLPSIDYRLVDNFTDPPGMTEQFSAEELLRLPECFLCYRPYTDSPEAGILPARANGFITFGSFNSFPKVSSQTLTMWTAILKAVPRSRLIIKAKSLSDATTRSHFINLITRSGLGKERIEMLHWVTSTKAHLDTYRRIDIGVDTFPYNGTTTTCEALWMGVPVITLAGKTHVSRVGASLLSNIGLPELIAKTPEEYVEIAIKLAHDLTRLRILRQNLRAMMSNSSLTNATLFTANLEDCYRTMWQRWCDSAK